MCATSRTCTGCVGTSCAILGAHCMLAHTFTHAMWQTRFPWQTQTHRWAMAESFHTPNEWFYVRNHTPAPLLSLPGDNPASYEISVSARAQDLARVGVALPAGAQQQPAGAQFGASLGDLARRYPQVTVTSVLQCCGNRGGQMVRDNPDTAFSDPRCCVCVCVLVAVAACATVCMCGCAVCAWYE